MKPNVLASTKDLPRAEWLELRRRGIGGSDAARVLGVSRWGGPLSVYMEKKGLYTPEDQPSEAAYWGTALEDLVAREFEARSGLKVRKENKIFQHAEYPWMLANIDRRIVGKNSGLECKTCSGFLADEWRGDELPDTYLCQIQHYIAVMDWESCYVAVLIGGQRFIWKEVWRDESFISLLVEKERDFWLNHFEKDVPPPIGINDDPSKLWAQREDNLLPDVDGEGLKTAQALLEVKERLKALEDEEKALENALKQRIGESAGLEGIATWKQTKDRVSVDWQAVASELGADGSVVSKYTETKPGYRRLLLDKALLKGA